MSTLREAAQQALDALYDIDATGVPVGHIDLVIDTLRAALAQQEQEPVAVHQFREANSAVWYDGHADHDDGNGPYEERVLYTSPPRRETEQEPVQEQKQEPYCHIYEYDLPSGKHRSFYPSLCKGRDANRAVAVYALPPRREWVSITDDEIEMAWMTTPEIHQLEGLLFARAIEQALKEKNNE